MNTTVTVALAIGAHGRPGRRRGPPAWPTGPACPACCSTSRSASPSARAASGSSSRTSRSRQTLGVAALVVILAEGGLTTRWGDVRRAIGPGLTLATVGVAVSVGVTAAITVLLLDFSWGYALLLAAVISSTDAAAVFATLRRLPLPRRMAASLEAESGLNDAPAILLVAVLAEIAHRGRDRRPGGSTALEIVGELLGGAVVGLADRLRRGPAAAPLGAPAGRLLPAGHAGAVRARLRLGGPAAHVGLRRRLPLRPGARQRDAAAPVGQRRVRRGHGLAGPDRPVRAARSPRLARPAAPRRSVPALLVGGALLLVAPSRCRWW